eukprot:TRINITY_DN2126_c0_g1_i1.p1 TRINITY_DN2126_c0_g1~~TRINITY_DN2126_c0_g1_i1.p1  ORF type:complete len:1679 (-),score=453.03 TRINITY_DN2126_c0_g1_i1:53-5089(-)
MSQAFGSPQNNRSKKSPPVAAKGSSNKLDSLSKWISDKLQKRKDQKKRASKEEVEPAKPKPQKVQVQNTTSLLIGGESTPGEPLEAENISGMLREWIFVKTKFSIGVIGEKGVGKRFLVNTLLESTFQNTHAPTNSSAPSASSSLESDFFLIDGEPSASNSSAMVIDQKMEEDFMDDAPSNANDGTEVILASEDFSSAVNWSSENEARKNMQQYYVGGKFNTATSDRYSFLLPQGPFSGIYSGSCVLSYAKTPELHVRFIGQDELRKRLFQLHQLLLGCAPNAVSETLDFLRREYRQILHLSRDQVIPLQNITSPADLPVPESTASLLGRSVTFRGRGRDPNIDRIFIREKMMETVNRFGFMTEATEVRMPCGILNGNRDLIVFDFNETEIFVSHNKDASLSNVNLLFVAVDSRGLSPHVKELLLRSRILEQMVRGSEQHKLVFIDLGEREQVSNSMSAKLNFRTSGYAIAMRNSLTEQLRGLFSEHFGTLSRPKIDKIVQNIGIYPVKPLLYSSISQNNGPSALLNQTNVPILLANITNTLLSKNAASLKNFNMDWMKDAKHKPELIQRVSNFISNKKKSHSPRESFGSMHIEPSVESDATIERLVQSFKQRMSQWKAQIASSEKILFTAVSQKAQECNRWPAETSLPVFCQFVQLWWEKRTIEGILVNWDKMALFCSELLTECSNSVKLPANSKEQEARFQQIFKFCKASAERTIRSRLNYFRQHMSDNDLPRMIRSICNEYHENVTINSFPCTNISPQAVGIICSRLSELLKFGIKQIEAVDKLMEDSLRCLVYSPFLQASQIMSFLISNQMPFETEQLRSTNKKAAGRPQSHDSRKSLSIPVPFNDESWTAMLHSQAQDLVLFQKQLGDSSLKLTEVELDGESQFRALSDQIYGLEEGYTIVRLLLMSEILSNPATYTRYVPKGVDLETYVYGMSKDGTEGDYLTLCAFSNFYNADVVVYSPKFQRPVVFQPHSNAPVDNAASPANRQRETYYLAIVGNNRYQPLSPIEETDDVDQELKKLDKLNLNNSIDRTSSKSEEPSSSNIAMEPSTSKFLKSDEDSEMQVQPPPKIFHSHVKSLTNLCVGVICEYVDYLPPLEGYLPEELVQRMLNILIADFKLDHKVLERLLDASIISLDLSNYRQITSAACGTVANLCRSLRRLNLSGCTPLTSADLAMIAKMSPRLEELDLETCPFLDNAALQALASHCPALVSLNLSDCPKVTDKGLEELLVTCKNLRFLNVSKCSQLTGSAFQIIGEQLEGLDVSGCVSLSEQAIMTLARKCPKLRRIKVSGKAATANALCAIATSCRSLESAELADCDAVTDIAVQTLVRECPKLTSVAFNCCKSITDDAFQDIADGKLPNLVHLDLTRCLSLNSQTLVRIAKKCPMLESICLASCEELSSEALVAVAGCRHLRNVNLSGCKNVTDEVVSAFTENKSLSAFPLQKLNLFNCNKITNACLVDVAKECPKLLELNVSSCDRISDEGIVHIAQSCRQLQALYVEECNISDAAVSVLVKVCRNIETLVLAYAKEITDASLDFLLGLEELKTLDLSHIKQLTSVKIGEMIPKFKKLRSLTLRGLSSFSTQGIAHPTLQTLNLSWCKNLEDSAVLNIGTDCPLLEALHLACCDLLTTNSIHALLKRAPNLQLLNIRGCNRVSQTVVHVLSATSGKSILK